MPTPSHFINKTPHLSLVWGEKNVAFLKHRFELLKQHPLFSDMQYSEDHAQLSRWMPLIMANREPKEKLAATFVAHGADVDFGALTRQLVGYLKTQENFTLLSNTQVKKLKKIKNCLLYTSRCV